MTKLTNELDQIQSKLKELEAHQARENKFAVEANERFEKNLIAFQNYYPDIYTEIAQYVPRDDFAIHVTKSGHGNFFIKDSKVAIYGDNPVEQVKKQYNKYIKKAHFAFFDFMSSAGKSDDELRADPRIHVRNMRNLSNLLAEYANDLGEPLTELSEYYPCAMMFGCGLGYQLSVLVENHTFEYMFVDEPDFEVFYASLYCTDWFDILSTIDERGGHLYLSIGVSTKEFFELVENVAHHQGACSIITSFCYQHYPSQEINESIKHFFNNSRLLHAGYGFYNDAITGFAHAVCNLENNVNFLVNGGQQNLLRAKLEQLPVYVVGNGPSLDEAISLLQETQDKVIIIAAGTAYQSLTNAGIKPDFHVLVERPLSQFHATKTLSEELPNGYRDTNLLGVEVLYPEIASLYKWVGYGLKGPEAASTFMHYHGVRQHGVDIPSLPYCGPMVSNLALAYGVMFGFGDIYMFGVDNGYTSEQTHSRFALYNDKKMQKKGFYTFAPSSANIELEGNIPGTKVMADVLYATSRDNMVKLANHASKSTIYNVGTGAFIRGTEVVENSDDIMLTDMSAVDKAKIVEEIKSTFFTTHISTDGLEEHVNVKEFDELCDYLISISERTYKTRKDAYKLLRAQQNVVYSYSSTAAAHLFHLLKGSMLYFHSPMVNNLFSFTDEAKSLELFDRSLALWVDYLQEMKADFRQNWRTPCTHSKFKV